MTFQRRGRPGYPCSSLRVGRTSPRRFLSVRSAILLAVALLAPALAGCANNSSTIPPPRGAPEACRTDPPPDAPYSVDALRNVSNVTDAEAFSKPQIEAIFSVLADNLHTFTGETYATAEGRLVPDDGQDWHFEIRGRFDNSSADRQAFGGALDGDSARVTGREVGGGAIPPRVVEEAERILRDDPRWTKVQNRSGNLTGARWDPAWPPCVLLQYDRPREYGYGPFGAWVYVHVEDGYVPEEAVCIEPTESLHCAEYI